MQPLPPCRVSAFRRDSTSSQRNVSIVETPNLTLVQCAFEKKEDAEKFGRAVQTRINGHYPGWASQRTFMFDVHATGAINTVLAR
jgi:hypothetical protein